MFAKGVTTADPDGAESGTPCSNASHAHHNGLNDTDWEQYKAMRKTTHWQLASPALRQNAGVGSDSSNTSTSESITSMPTCGFIAGMPGSFLEQGESKVRIIRVVRAHYESYESYEYTTNHMIRE